MITPQIQSLSKKKLIGRKMRMSLVNNKTAELWKNFMPLSKDIAHKTSNDFISLQVYDASYFQQFNASAEFEKWAAVEVDNYDDLPASMERFDLSGGLYAVFQYKGLNTDHSIFQYIFGTWLPNSNFLLDQRPHFEILGEKYKNNNPNSEEEIWIPIKNKA